MDDTENTMNNKETITAQVLLVYKTKNCTFKDLNNIYNIYNINLIILTNYIILNNHPCTRSYELYYHKDAFFDKNLPKHFKKVLIDNAYEYIKKTTFPEIQTIFGNAKHPMVLDRGSYEIFSELKSKHYKQKLILIDPLINNRYDVGFNPNKQWLSCEKNYVRSNYIKIIYTNNKYYAHFMYTHMLIPKTNKNSTTTCVGLHYFDTILGRHTKLINKKYIRKVIGTFVKSNIGNHITEKHFDPKLIRMGMRQHSVSSELNQIQYNYFIKHFIRQLNLNNISYDFPSLGYSSSK